MAGGNMLGGALGGIEGFGRRIGLSKMRGDARKISAAFAEGHMGHKMAGSVLGTFGNMSNVGVMGTAGGAMAAGTAAQMISYHRKSMETPDTPIRNLYGSAMDNNLTAAVGATAAMGGFGLYRGIAGRMIK